MSSESQGSASTVCLRVLLDGGHVIPVIATEEEAQRILLVLSQYFKIMASGEDPEKELPGIITSAGMFVASMACVLGAYIVRDLEPSETERRYVDAQEKLAQAQKELADLARRQMDQGEDWRRGPDEEDDEEEEDK